MGKFVTTSMASGRLQSCQRGGSVSSGWCDQSRCIRDHVCIIQCDKGQVCSRQAVMMLMDTHSSIDRRDRPSQLLKQRQAAAR